MKLKVRLRCPSTHFLHWSVETVGLSFDEESAQSFANVVSLTLWLLEANSFINSLELINSSTKGRISHVKHLPCLSCLC